MSIAVLYVVALPVCSQVANPISKTIVQGLRFNPETFNSNGKAYKGAWLNVYSDPIVRSQVQGEFVAIRQSSHLSTISLLVSANQHLKWPVPAEAELQNLINFLNDADAQGLQVILLVSTPCVIPNSAVPVGSPKVHVGGHHRGEVVNGVQLYWDVAFCADNSIELAQRWYGQILSSLSRGIKSPNVIAYFGLMGNPTLPFATEMNVFYDDYPQLKFAQQYVARLVPYLRSQTVFKLGISLLPGFWSNDPTFQYSFLKNLKAAITFSSFDYLDITSSDQIDISAILNRVGSKNAPRIILSDFKYGESRKSQAAVTSFHLAQVRQHGLGGYWVWQYKDDPELGNQGLGIRRSGFFGATGGWKTGVLAALP